MEETLVRLKKGIHLHLELMREDREKIPKVFESNFSLDVRVAGDSG